MLFRSELASKPSDEGLLASSTNQRSDVSLIMPLDASGVGVFCGSRRCAAPNDKSGTNNRAKNVMYLFMIIASFINAFRIVTSEPQPLLMLSPFVASPFVASPFVALPALGVR